MTMFKAVKFGFQQAGRNLWLSLATVFVLSLTALSVTLVAGMNWLGGRMLAQVEDKVDIELFFNPQAAEDAMLGARSDISAFPEVTEALFISPEDALARFLAQHAEDPAIMASVDSLDFNPFPGSIIIKTGRLEDYAAVLNRVERSPWNDQIQLKEFDDHEAVIGTIQRTIRRLSQVGFGLSGLFVLISVVLVFNAIRIAVFSHGDELKIMRLVGATNGLIRGPFLVASALYALTAGLVASAVALAAVSVVQPYLADVLDGIEPVGGLQWLRFGPLLLGAEWLTAGILAVGSTAIALRRYLKS